MSAALRPKDINFYSVYYEKPAKSAEQKKKRRQILLPVLLILLLGGTYGFFEYRIYQLAELTAPKIAFIQDASAQELAAIAKTTDAQFAALSASRDNLVKAESALASYPALKNADFAAMDACFSGYAGITGIEFLSDAATLEFTAMTTTVSAAADCAERLRNTGMFGDIGYFGYASDDKLSYNFTVTCVLKAVELQ